MQLLRPCRDPSVLRLNPYFLLFFYFHKFIALRKKALDEDRYGEKDCCALTMRLDRSHGYTQAATRRTGLLQDSTRSSVASNRRLWGDGFLDPSRCFRET